MPLGIGIAIVLYSCRRTVVYSTVCTVYGTERIFQRLFNAPSPDVKALDFGLWTTHL